jgi:hypothetical protein
MMANQQMHWNLVALKTAWAVRQGTPESKEEAIRECREAMDSVGLTGLPVTWGTVGVMSAFTHLGFLYATSDRVEEAVEVSRRVRAPHPTVIDSSVSSG